MKHRIPISSSGGLALVATALAAMSFMAMMGCEKEIAKSDNNANSPMASRSPGPSGPGMQNQPAPKTGGGDTKKPTPEVRPTPDPDPPFVPSGNIGFAIGDMAPEIEGPDLDGVNFKLSDYRGKVVVLDFWGDW